jgi:beta-lactamase regulating signal transducer with metallopeptidase domain
VIAWLAYNALAALPFALVALVAERVLRRRPAAVHFLWLLFLARLVVPPLGLGEQPSATSTPALITSGPSWGAELVGWATRTLGSNWSFGVARWATIALWTGLAACLAYELVQLLRARAGVRQAASASDELVRRTRAVAERVGVRPPPVRVLAGLRSPFVWSPARPLLVLPERAPDATVLAHELAHLRRRDHWTAWLELVALGLCWWNPLVWYARRRLQLFAELACDACVVAHFPARRTSYARALVDGLGPAPHAPAETRRVPRTMRAIGWSAVELELRLLRILGGEDSARVPRWLGLVGCSCLVLSLPGLGAPDLQRFRAALPAIPNGLDRAAAEQVLEQVERGLELAPQDGAAFARRGFALMGLGRYEEAAQAFEQEMLLGHRPERAAYNLACAHARAGALEPALEALEAALALGIPPDYLRQDQDLEALRGHADFERLAAAASGP